MRYSRFYAATNRCSDGHPPRAGDVKTRLVPVLTETQAAELAACFLRDTVFNVQRTFAQIVIAYTPADAHPELETVLPPGLLWFEQNGRHLGERLESVALHVSNLGCRPFIILGADSPTLPSSLIKQAIDVLVQAQAEIAIGPTVDRGYYLVGLNCAVPGLFQNINWSTSLAYEQTVCNATAFNLRLHSLPMWYDIDTPADLRRLSGEMCSNGEILRTHAPHTYCWFINHRSLLSFNDQSG